MRTPGMTTLCWPIVQESPMAALSWMRACGRMSHDLPTVAPSTRALRPMYVELAALAHPDVAAEADPGDLERHPLVEGVEVRLPELVEVADVLPVTLGD